MKRLNFSALAIGRPIPVLILCAVITLLGLIAGYKLPIKYFPDMEYPAINIDISWPGAAAGQIETEITRKVEDSLSNVAGIRHISSRLNNGSSFTQVELELDQNTDEALVEIKDALAKTRADLPPDIPEPIVSKIKFGGGVILTYAIHAPNLDAADLSWLVDNDLNRILFAIPGVAKVSRQGGVEREIQVLVDPLRLSSLDITISDLASKFKELLRTDVPAGTATLNQENLNIQTGNHINSLAELALLNIPLSADSYMHLADLATIHDTQAEIKQLAFYNGESVISFQVYAAKGASELNVAKLVRQQIQNFNTSHPQLKISEIYDNTVRISQSYQASLQALVEGCLLAILVVYCFLRDRRATLIAATAIPLSIIPTLLCIYWLGFSLNTISLLALTLVAGILVDDAIVEIENIFRHLTHRAASTQSARAATLSATAEIGLAVMATSLSVVAVFLPTAFMSGINGRFFRQFGFTAAIAVVMSLLVARLITPILAAYLLKPRPPKTAPAGWLSLNYMRLVQYCLNQRAKTCLITAIFFSGSCLLVKYLPSSFFPHDEDNQIHFSVKLPQNITLPDLTNLLQQAYSNTQTTPGVAGIYATSGTGSGTGSTDNAGNNYQQKTADLIFYLQERKNRQLSQAEITQLLNQRLLSISGAKFSLGDANTRNSQYSIVLSSEDAELLQKVAASAEKEIQKLPGIGNINSDFDNTSASVIITPQRVAAAALGITPYAIGSLVQLATAGDYSQNLAKISLGTQIIPVRLKLAANNAQSIEQLQNLKLSGNGGLVQLGNVANLSLGSGINTLQRYDHQRSVTLSIYSQGRNIGELDQQINSVPSLQHLPAEIHKSNAGELEQMQSMFKNFILAIGSGICVVYLLLAILFNGFKQPLTILMALPLAIGGALAGLVIFGFSISMPALIGILMLMGIVAKNSILLVDYALIAINQDGLTPRAAILQACQKRARPIIMTTLAMIAGMLPLALGFSHDSSFNQPLAVTVIGGLISSTLLSLIVVPVIFDLFAGLANKRRRITSRRNTAWRAKR